jgi:hypothetical protein
MDQEQEKPKPIKFDWIKPKEATPEIYCNYFHPSWTLFDVRIQLGQLVPRDSDPASGFVVEQRGAVTVGWGELKLIRNGLSDLVAKYERVNGEIKTPKLAPNTDNAES